MIPSTSSSAGACRRREAFTLIELLVVISIVALLISILLPVLSNAREAARQAVCKSTVRSLVLAVHVYANDEDDFLPDANRASPGGIYSGRYEFLNTMRYYLAENYGLSAPGAWACPTALDQNRFTAIKLVDQFPLPPTPTPGEDNNRSRIPFGYLVGGYNHDVTNDRKGVVQYDSVPGWNRATVIRITDSKKPTDRIAWWDAIVPPERLSANGTVFSWSIPANNHSSSNWNPDGANYGMLDGHVEWREVRWSDNMYPLPGDIGVQEWYAWKR